MAVPQFLRRFITPGRPERAALYTVALGAAALIDPAKLTPGGRAAYRLTLAGITAAVVAGDTQRAVGPQGRSAAATAATVAGGAVLGLAEAGEALDAKLQRSLVRRGVSKPRLVFAAVTAGLTLATELPALLAARRWVSYRSGNSQHMDVVDHVPFGEFPEGARTLITGMLDFSADPSAEALRAQLASAHERLGVGGSGSFDAIDIIVFDAEALPRAVPHRQQFPVVAEFADPNTGSPRVVRLGIDGGSLAQLTIEADDRAADSEWLWPERWPALAEVTFSVEGSEPLDTRAAKRARAATRH
ncbi:hypothetical protein ACI1US_01782 [Leucobacter sp. BZR 635]